MFYNFRNKTWSIWDAEINSVSELLSRFIWTSVKVCLDLEVHSGKNDRLGLV